MKKRWLATRRVPTTKDEGVFTPKTLEVSTNDSLEQENETAVASRGTYLIVALTAGCAKKEAARIRLL